MPRPVNFAMSDGYSNIQRQGGRALPVFAVDVLMG
jgi:hypothetical protein